MVSFIKRLTPFGKMSVGLAAGSLLAWGYSEYSKKKKQDEYQPYEDFSLKDFHSDGTLKTIQNTVVSADSLERRAANIKNLGQYDSDFYNQKNNNLSELPKSGLGSGLFIFSTLMLALAAFKPVRRILKDRANALIIIAGVGVTSHAISAFLGRKGSKVIQSVGSKETGASYHRTEDLRETAELIEDYRQKLSAYKSVVPTLERYESLSPRDKELVGGKPQVQEMKDKVLGEYISDLYSRIDQRLSTYERMAKIGF